MIKLIHFADLHLNAPLTSRVDWDTANKLRETKFRVIDNIVLAAAERQTDLILIAGDLLDSRFTDEKTIRFLKERFAKTNAKVFISLGNHDYRAVSQLTGNLGENVYVFGSKMERVSLSGLGCDVYGQSFDRSFVREGMLKGFQVENPDALNLMVMHGDLQTQSDYNPISFEDIENSGLDYLALGHIHNEKTLRRAGKTHYGYSGTPQPHSFKDCTAPSVNCVELSKQEVHLEYIDVSEYRFFQLEADVSQCNTTYDILDTVLHETEPYGPDTNLFQVALSGTLAEGIFLDLERMEKELSSSFLHIELKNQTRSPIDMETVRLEQTLRGEFVRLVTGDQSLTEKERREILECGINATNPLSTREGLL